MQSPRYRLQNTFSQGLINYGEENGQDTFIISMEKMEDDKEVMIINPAIMSEISTTSLILQFFIAMPHTGD